MNESLEKLIRENLEAEKIPKLSPFFAAKVVNQNKLKPQPSRFSKLILWSYWCFVSCFAIFFVTDLVWSAWIILIVLILIPIRFFLTIIQKSLD